MSLAVRFLLSLALVQWLIVGVQTPSVAGCNGAVNLKNIEQTCRTDGSGALPVGDGAGGPEVLLYPACAVKVGTLCGRNLTCTTSAGQPGVMYHVTIDGVAEPQRCISQGEANDAGVITPGQVLTALRRLDWPPPKLVVQPPDGLTLVNFATNFYTPSTSPITRRVSLLGRRITIEATPSEFHWTFGDGDSLTTTEPGAPYPALDVTHDYLRKGTYRPSLATTYGGRYRIGGGAWQEIPGTVTVAGAAQSLRAIEARPKLVGY